MKNQDARKEKTYKGFNILPTANKTWAVEKENDLFDVFKTLQEAKNYITKRAGY